MKHFIKLSSNAKYLIVAEFEKIIHVWDFSNKKKLYIIKTSFETSSERIAISNNETTFVSCLWNRKSIILHNLTDGTKIWENKEINHIHSLTFSFDDKLIFVQNENYFYVLDSFNGNIIKKENGNCKKFDSEYNDFTITVKYKKYYNIVNGNINSNIPLKSFSFLDLCIGVNNFYVSEVAGNLRCISLEKGEELWSYTPETGKHFLKVCYNMDFEIVYCIQYQYDNSSKNELFVFDANTGLIIYNLNLKNNLIDRCFDKYGKILLTLKGDIYYLDKDKSKIIVDKIELE